MGSSEAERPFKCLAYSRCFKNMSSMEDWFSEKCSISIFIAISITNDKNSLWNQDFPTLFYVERLTSKWRDLPISLMTIGIKDKITALAQFKPIDFT